MLIFKDYETLIEIMSITHICFRYSHERKMTTSCTRKELDSIANDWLKEYNGRYDYVCCIANEGDTADNRHFSIMYQDCM